MMHKILFFNEYGFESSRDGMDPDAFVKYLFGLGVDNVIITMSSKGCRVISPTEDFLVDAYHVKPVDTNGAGDTFNASYVYALSEGMNLHGAAEFATAAAARCLLYKGARGGVAEKEEIYEYMKENSSLHQKI